MKKIILLVLLIGLSLNFMITGCGTQTESASAAAIEASKKLATVQEQTTYLIGQAQTLYNSKEFQQVIDIAQYILRFLDKDSQEAMSLLEKAKDALLSQAGSSMEDIKKSLSGYGE